MFETNEVTEIEQQEFNVQGVGFDALFVHEVSKNLHIGIKEEDERFIVFSIENGILSFSVLNMWDDLDSAHRDFMRLYESKRQT